MLLLFQPVIGLQRDDQHSQVQYIFFQSQQIIGAEHITEKISLADIEETCGKIYEKQNIHDGDECSGIPFFFSQLNKQGDKEDRCDQQFLFH